MMSNKAALKKFGSRTFSNISKGGTEVVATIYEPVADGDNCYCRIEIDGLGDDIIAEDMYGADSIQAIQLAIEKIRSTLYSHPDTVTWYGDRDLLIPRSVSHIYGFEFDMHLQKIIDAEIDAKTKSEVERYAGKRSV